MIKKIVSLFLLCFFSYYAYAEEVIKPGAENFNAYFPLLKNKRVAVFANHSSLVDGESLINVLLAHHIHVVKIFAPEHGFRGEKDERIRDSIDQKTHLPIISLYGKKLTPTFDDLRDVDVIVFDIQDVGVRFYTYISSLQKMMEAATYYQKPLIILDRPNPNGFYVDGPVLERKYHSFTGMQPIPVVYGMTMGEYAKMLVGERWLNVTPKEKAGQLQLTIIPCENYTHKSLYIPPVKPSPNLPDIQSIYWYPSIGMMEGTAMSVGRGTAHPFEVFGNPRLHTAFYFVPTPHPGAESPRFKYKKCYGWNLENRKLSALQKIQGKLRIQYLMQAYRHYPDKKHFFAGFSAVSGNSELEKQIRAGISEKRIRASWQPALIAFKKIRKQYLLYPDFE